MRELLIATTNADKARELLAGLGEIPFKILTLKDIESVGDVEENAETLEENAAIKAKEYGQRTGKLTLADDTGLFVDALGGRPGAHSARYCEGSMARGIEKILSEMKDVPDDKRGAFFRTVIALYDPATDTLRTCEGRAEGRIAHEARGENNFGFDPIFDYESKGRTGGELSFEEKQAIGHRFQAARKAREILLAEFK